MARAGSVLLHPVVFRVLVVLITLSVVVALGTGYVLDRVDRGVRVPGRQEPADFPASAEDGSKSRQKPLAAYAPIARRDLFGTAEARRALEALRKEEVDVSEIPLAAESLRLNLKGTVIGSDGTERVAVIEDQQTRKQGLYREGDRIRNALIKSILRNNVVINTGTRDEVLTINPEQRSNGALAGPGAVNGEAGEPTTLSREFLERSLEDLGDVLESVTIRPQRLPDGSTGFRVTRVRPNSVFAKLGLRNNDVVAELNGVPLQSQGELLETIQGLQSGEEVELSVRRGSRMTSFRYRVE
jgi:general secretion pathway protein C